MVNGRRRDIGLGGYPTVRLTEARTQAAANRIIVSEGRDPVAEKRRPPKPTFKEAAHQVHQANLPRWRNASTPPPGFAPWSGCFSRFRKHALDQVTRADVLAVLEPIWGTLPETARRVRQRTRTVMRWAMAHGFVEYNMAGEAI